MSSPEIALKSWPPISEHVGALVSVLLNVMPRAENDAPGDA